MVIDYSEMFNKIVDKISTYPSRSFRHVERVDWLDTEGQFPKARIGNSFSTFIEEVVEEEDSISENISLMRVNIQFALNGNQNTYVKDLGFCQEAIFTLQTLNSGSAENFKMQKVKPYFICEPLGSLVRVEFEDINFSIDNNV